MKRFTVATICAALLATSVAMPASAHDHGRWRGHRSRVIVEQPTLGLGLGIGALLLLSQMGQQKQYVEQAPQEFYSPPPREPKLRSNPVPLK